MKIISQYKDYYDFLQGKYGMDEKATLDRSTEVKSNLSKDAVFEKKGWSVEFKENELYTFHICGFKYRMIFYKGELFDFKDLKKRGLSYSTYKKEVYELPPERHSSWYNRFRRRNAAKDLARKLEEEEKEKLTDLNDKLKCPIIVETSTEVVKFPRLDIFKLASLLPPEEIWFMLYNWLMKTPELINNSTDKEKILQHGFDLKTSFRKM